MLHLRRGHALGVDVADLLELEGAFQRDGVVVPAPEEEPVLALDVLAVASRIDRSARGRVSILSGIAASSSSRVLDLLGERNRRRPMKVASSVSHHDLAEERLGDATPISGPTRR